MEMAFGLKTGKQSAGLSSGSLVSSAGGVMDLVIYV